LKFLTNNLSGIITNGTLKGLERQIMSKSYCLYELSL